MPTEPTSRNVRLPHAKTLRHLPSQAVTPGTTRAVYARILAAANNTGEAGQRDNGHDLQPPPQRDVVQIRGWPAPAGQVETVAVPDFITGPGGDGVGSRDLVNGGLPIQLKQNRPCRDRGGQRYDPKYNQATAERASVAAGTESLVRHWSYLRLPWSGFRSLHGVTANAMPRDVAEILSQGRRAPILPASFPDVGVPISDREGQTRSRSSKKPPSRGRSQSFSNKNFSCFVSVRPWPDDYVLATRPSQSTLQRWWMPSRRAASARLSPLAIRAWGIIAVSSRAAGVGTSSPDLYTCTRVTPAAVKRCTPTGVD